MSSFGGCVRGVCLGLGWWVVAAGVGAARGDEPASRPAEAGASSGAYAEYTEPFGGKDGEARLVRLIEQSLPPATRPSGDEEALRGGRSKLNEFPKLGQARSGGNLGNQASEVRQILCGDYELREELERFAPGVVCSELERQSAVAQDPAVKLYLAGLAGHAGSRVGAMHLLETMKSTDYGTLINLHTALGIALGGTKDESKDWAGELAMVVLTDRRVVTGVERTDPSQGAALTVGKLAMSDGDLVRELGYAKCRRAVPFLIDMAEGKLPYSDKEAAIAALGMAGDERGIPVVMKVLTTERGPIGLSSYALEPQRFDTAVRAAGGLKAKAAVPVLLEHLCHKEVIEALEAIGDPAVVPALEKIVATGKPMQVKGSNSKTDKECVDAAKIALVTLKNRDPVPGYCGLLTDFAMGEFARRDVVFRLRDRADPRAIPHLVRAAKYDAGCVVYEAISVLSTLKYAAAAEGLMECFDANFEGKWTPKLAHRPVDFRRHIAKSLKRLTGKDLGLDRQVWSEWWRREGRDSGEWKAEHKE